MLMKYVKPLQLFMEMQKPCPADSWIVLGLTYTARHLSMSWAASTRTDARHHWYYPHETRSRSRSIVKELSQFRDKEILVGIVVGKNCVGAPMDTLIDDLCKSGNFESLKYTYWVDNIISANSESASKFAVISHFFSYEASKRVLTDRVSAFRMLHGYMDFCNTLIERPKEDFIRQKKEDEGEDDEEDDEENNGEDDEEDGVAPK